LLRIDQSKKIGWGTSEYCFKASRQK